MLKRTLLLLLVLVTAGCSANPPAASPEAALAGQPAATATLAPTATETPLPSATPEPTLTPTPALPVGLGTPAPLVSQPIEAANADQLRLLAVYAGDPSGSTVVSRDAQKAVFSSPEGTEIFDLAAGELVASLEAGIAYDRFGFSKGWLSMSEDGSVIGLVAPDAVKILAADGTLLYSVANRLNEDYPALTIMDGVGVSSDGRMAAIVECAEGEYDGCPFQVIDTQTGVSVYTWGGKQLEAHGSAPLFSPDGAYLATWFDSQLWLWSTTDWVLVASIPAEEMAGWVFSPDGQQILVGWGTLQVWDIAGRELLAEYALDDGVNAKALYVSGDGQWYGSIDYSGRAAVWKTGTDEPLEITDLGVVDVARVSLVDGKFELLTLPGHDPDLWTGGAGESAFQFVAGEDGPELMAVSNRSGKSCLVGLARLPRCSMADLAAVGPDQQIVFGANQDGVVEVRSTSDASGDLLASLEWAGYRFYLNGYDSQSGLLFYTVFSSPNNASGFIYDIEKAAVVKKFDSGRLSGVRYSPDGHYAVFAVNHNPRLDVVVFDLTQQTVAFQNSFQYGIDDSLIFTPDGQKIALLAASNSQPLNAIQVIDLASPHTITAIPFDLAEGESIRSMAFSPDGSLAAAGLRDGRILLVQAPDGAPVHAWQAYREWVDGLAFTPDGSMLASIGVSGYLKFWGIWP